MSQRDQHSLNVLIVLLHGQQLVSGALPSAGRITGFLLRS